MNLNLKKRKRTISKITVNINRIVTKIRGIRITVTTKRSINKSIRATIIIILVIILIPF